MSRSPSTQGGAGGGVEDAARGPGAALAASAAELRCRAVRHGLQALDETETLQLLIARAAPGRAAELAGLLMTRFGGLPQILGATLAELTQVADAGVALELKLLQDAARRALEFPLRRRSILSSWSAVAAYLRISLGGHSRESFRVLFLDRRNGLIADELMGAGSIDHAPVYPREVVRRALELAASSCCLVHNHPSGDPTPSTADVDLTRRVVEACRSLGIVVHDHYLVAGDQVVSFRAAGLM